MTAGTKSMQNKKKQVSTTSSKQEAVPTASSLFSFVGDIKSEFKKITWTNKEELLGYTKIVVVATSLMGLGIFFIDTIIQGVLAGLGELVRLVVG